MIRLASAGYAVDDGRFTGIDFHLPEGGVAVILGARRAGKSDFINACLGKLPFDAGSVTLLGERLTPGDGPPSSLLRRIGEVTQHDTLLDNLTVAANVGLPIAYHEGVGARELRQRVMPHLTRLGIAAIADQFPHQINRNQEKMAMLARATINAPRLLVMDEPTAGDLDPAGFIEVMKAIKGFLAEGLTLLITTCSPSLAAIEKASFYYLVDRRLIPHTDRLETSDRAAIEFFRQIRNYTERQKREISGFYKILFKDEKAENE